MPSKGCRADLVSAKCPSPRGLVGGVPVEVQNFGLALPAGRAAKFWKTIEQGHEILDNIKKFIINYMQTCIYKVSIRTQYSLGK